MNGDQETITPQSTLPFHTLSLKTPSTLLVQTYPSMIIGITDSKSSQYVPWRKKSYDKHTQANSQTPVNNKYNYILSTKLFSLQYNSTLTMNHQKNKQKPLVTFNLHKQTQIITTSTQRIKVSETTIKQTREGKTPKKTTNLRQDWIVLRLFKCVCCISEPALCLSKSLSSTHACTLRILSGRTLLS